jgi:ACS family hexuronate transporter-like MFS transporter
MRFFRDRYRWLIVGLLFFMSVNNYLDRQALSVLAKTLREKLHFGTVEYSYIVTGFLVAFAIGYTFCGVLLDRYGVRRVYAIALAAWTVAIFFHAAAASWISLALCRFALGLGESFNTPAGAKIVADWVPRRERGLSMAIFSNGNMIGAMIAPPLISAVALHFGWQWSFVVSGSVGLVVLAVWWRVYHPPEVHPRVSAQELAYIRQERGETSAATASWRVVLRNPLCWGFLGARFLTDSLSFFFSFWLPEYLQTSRGFSLALLGIVGWIPFLAADLGGPGGGALSDWFVRRGIATRKARLSLMAGAALLMPLSLWAVRTPSAALAVGLIAVLLMAASCWNVNLLTLASESVPRGQVGTLFALSGLGGAIGGIISTLATGQTIQRFGYVPVFTVIGALHLSAFVILMIALHRSRKYSPALGTSN